ncbi:MAG: retropepsin-like aspartic protease family protein [Pseudomonadota bacterium]
MTDKSQPTDTSRPLGRGMLIVGWVVGLGLLSLLFGDLLEQQRNPNQNLSATTTEGGVREVVLERNRGGHYMANGSINGHEVEFLLDTGASDVSIPAPVAHRLGLERGAARRYGTANGTITAYSTTIPRLELGGIALHDVRASINPHMAGETILLGMSFLRHLEFTQRDGELILRQY